MRWEEEEGFLRRKEERGNREDGSRDRLEGGIGKRGTLYRAPTREEKGMGIGEAEGWRRTKGAGGSRSGRDRRGRHGRRGEGSDNGGRSRRPLSTRPGHWPGRCL